MFTVDQKLATYCKYEMSSGLHQFFKLATDMALGAPYIGAVLVGFLVLTVMARFREISEFLELLRRWCLFAFLSLFTGGVITQLTKISVGRRRPLHLNDYDPFVFDHFTFHWDFHSYPSGHTQVAFTFATIMSLTFPKWSLAFMAWAILMGASRVALTVHFLSDTVLASGIAIAATLFVRDQLKRRDWI